MEFNSNGNTISRHNFRTVDESSSYGMEIHKQAQCLQADFQNRIPLEIQQYPNSFKTDILFRETECHRSLSATPLFATGVRSPVDKAPQYHQTSPTIGIPYNHTVNPIETPNLKGISSCAVDISREIDFYRMGNPMEKGLNGITSYNTGSPRQKTLPNGITSFRMGNDPREKDLNRIASDQTKSSGQMDPNHKADRDEMHYYGGEERDCGQAVTRGNLQFDQMPFNPLNQTCNSETSSQQINRPPEGTLFFRTELQSEVLTSRADNRAANEGENDSTNLQTNAQVRMSSYQPVTIQQTSGKVIGLTNSTKTCPLCHCVLATQPQPVSHPATPNLQNTRKSVIMIPLNREDERTNETPELFRARDQERSSITKRPQEKDSDRSDEELDDDEVQERFFRVNIDGTTAKFKLTDEDWARMPIKTFPSGGRLLSGDWTRIFLSKVKESNPWCSLRFKNNHVRSENSRKIHSAAFFRGGAECKFPECNVKMRFVIRKEYGRRVDVTYIGNVCHVC